MPTMRYYLILASLIAGLAFMRDAITADVWWQRAIYMLNSAMWLIVLGWAVTKKEQDQ